MLRVDLSLRPAMAGVACVLLMAAAHAEGASPDIGASVVAQPGRPDADREMDARREPAKLLDFTGVEPGMKVLDVMAGGGYTTELLARAVGKAGKVYAQNSPTAPSGAKLAARLKNPVLANVVPVTAPLDSPVPAGVRDLDLETFILNYHDVTYLPVDRAKMNKALFDGLRHGGMLVIVDHAAKAGEGATVGKTLHRVEEATVVSEVEAAGFRKVAEGDFLRHPEDPKTEPFFKMSQPTDQFVLKFEKP